MKKIIHYWNNIDPVAFCAWGWGMVLGGLLLVLAYCEIFKIDI